MERIKIIIFLTFMSCLLLILNSCDKPDNFSKLNLNYQYQAKFSLPIVDSLSITLKQSAKNLPYNWEKYPDSLLKTLPVINFSDSLPFDFKSLADSSKYIKSLTFRFQVSSDFPQFAEFSLYLIDSVSGTVDSLKTPLKIPQAKLINDTTLVKRDTLESFEIDKTQFQKWDNVKWMVLEGYMKNAVDSISFYKKYHLYRIVISAGIRVDFDYPLKMSKK